MWGVTDLYLKIIRGNHQKVTVGTHVDLFTGVETVLGWSLGNDDDDQPPFILGGSVTVDATSNVRRKIDSLTLPPQQALWDALDTVGGEITLSRGVNTGAGGIELVPLGVFIVDTDGIGYGPGGQITINAAPDRWGKIQKAKLRPTERASIRSNLAWQEIQRLVEGAWSTAFPFPGWTSLDTTTATAKVGALIWDDGDREKAILDLCRDNAVEVFFDATGQAVLQPVPQLSDTADPVWTIDANGNGVLLDANRTRDRSRAFNAIEVSSSATDVIFLPVVVENTLPSDPMNTSGTLGYHATTYSSSSIRNSAQAKAVGQALLAKSVGVAKDLTLSAVQNDALDAGDVILVGLPKTDVNLQRPTELHIIDTVTIPFEPQGVMEIQTRSTVPANLGS